MSSTREDGVQATLYEAPSDINEILRAKDEIIVKLTADLTQANADKDDLQASLTQQEQENAILDNVNDEQDVRIVELEASLTEQMDENRGLELQVQCFKEYTSNLMDEIYRLETKVSGQNKRLDFQKREIQALDAQIAIWETVVDEDNASTNSDSSSTDYNLMDVASDEEEGEDIDEECGYFPARYYNDSDNSSTSTGTIRIDSDDEAMDDD
ncbi:hypothetical protein FCIRC_8187 [Fusarium circinatum]|uniref:Uncharacterized protein n=1 Tax=Fusarium circinatum TaxID=48490 RepID=A0A8H5WWR5_FUSCI|nr:hypothetical protein FCIRC_8187 [Fusarium circinatum]